MKDRQPTQVLANGAIRYGVYNADGTLDHYEYLKREDAPTVEGTPLNKANLLSDTTAAKLWPNAATRPEDPTVNDALGKLSEGTAKVGDIAITSRTDLSDAWLPCDGRYISEEQYPKLFSTLRVSASAAPWDAKLLPAGTNDSSNRETSSLSHANGYWFFCKHRHLYYSADLVSWTDITPSDLSRYNTSQYTANVFSIYGVHYWQGKYVCLALCYVALNEWAYVVLSTDQLAQSGWKVTSVPEIFDATDELSVRSLFWDGTYYYCFITRTYYDSNDHIDVTNCYLYYTTDIAEYFKPNTSGPWSSNVWTSSVDYIDYYDETTGWFYLSRRSSPTSKISYIYKTQRILGTITKTFIPVPNTEYSTTMHDVLSAYVVEGNIIVARYRPSSLSGLPITLYRSEDGGETFEQVYSETSNASDDHTGYMDLVAELLCAWDPNTIVLFDADNITIQTITPGQRLSAIAASHANTVAIISEDGNYVYHQDFTHSKKKIPSITTDTRSKAYIKALEE